MSSANQEKKHFTKQEIEEFLSISEALDKSFQEGTRFHSDNPALCEKVQNFKINLIAQILYNNKDFGQYAENGKMPVCFIGSNHSTGGNSGSPAIDAHGNLIGLNFDRVWEGTMSDYNYDASICRNIMVDIRFVLFIIDKYAGASHLIEEMKLVHPKSEME